MIWGLDWHVVARRDLLNMPWRTAARIDAAVMLFAETGRGDVRQLAPPDPRRLVLSVRGASALLYLDLERRTILIGRVLRSA